MTEDILLDAIKYRLKHPKTDIREAYSPRPPLNLDELYLAEATLEQPLPHLFARLYLEIGDGGWGPWAGLCPMGVRGDEDEPEFSVLGQWQMQKDRGDRLLAFCDGGCTVFSVLNLTTGTVGLRDDIDTVLWQAESLHDWLELWLAGKHVMSFTEKL